MQKKNCLRKWKKMMENLTFSDVSTALTVLVGFIGSVGYLRTKMKKWIKSAFDDSDLNKELKEVSDRLCKVDMESCKNYLVVTISGIEKGHHLCDIEHERFWEQYEHYQKIGGNSYISRKVEQLKEEDRI